MTLLSRFQEVTTAQVVAHQGEIIKSYGDGSLILFDSTVNAVQCAMAMQVEFAKDPKVPLRIGVHEGDVIHRDKDVFGNGVNIASRIESIGVAGAILISVDVQKRIKNQESILTQSVGTFEFKNVDEPMQVFAIANEGFVIPTLEKIQGKLKTAKPKRKLKLVLAFAGLLALLLGCFYFLNLSKASQAEASDASIAVLPFQDMSPNKDQEYFADGIAEEILNTLANLKEIKVAGRTSSFSFKGKEATIAEIGKTLQVNHVLEGSVRKQGDKIRITAQLIKVNDGFHIWSEKYDRDFNDVFAIQDELAQSIGEVLLDKLAPEQIEKLKTTLPRNSEAYKLFLSGKHLHWNVYRKGGSQEAFQKSEEAFLEAIQLDSTYALAYAGLADLYDTASGAMESKGYTIIRNKYRKLSQQYSDLAFRLGSELSYVNTVKGYAEVTKSDYSAALKSLLKGYQLAPNNPDAIFGLQYFYRALGLSEDALIVGNKMKELDPLDVSGLTERLYNNYRLGNGEQVTEDGLHLLYLEPNNLYVMRSMFYNYFVMNKKEKALSTIQQVYQIDSTYLDYIDSFWVALIRGDQNYITKKRKEGTHYDRFIIQKFYGEDDEAEKELKIHLKNYNHDGANEKNTYLIFSRSPLFEKYRDKDWFKKFIALEKKKYDTVLNQFPRAEEILINPIKG